MNLWYNPNLNKMITTISIGYNSYIISLDMYKFNGKSFTFLDLLNLGYEEIGSVF